MQQVRKSGILLHPTSLPGKYGIGTLGEYAYKFIDYLEETGQKLWQVLPLGPTGYGDSPYASFSTFAGNPLLIDLDKLVERNWCSKKDIIPCEYLKPEGNVDFGTVVWWKLPVLFSAAKYFLANANEDDKLLYKGFCKKSSLWLDMYCIFMSIKNFYDKKAQEENTNASIWYSYWPKELASCSKEAVAEWKKNHKEEIELYKVIQFFFDIQWNELKSYANDKNILIIGDIPIFVAIDSADVWANQSLFQLEKSGKPLCVAGVPPDYFSATGQLWGNPLYDWDAMKKTGYNWWIIRIKRILELTDILRIDHFRGFEAYWSVPFGQETAVNGKWIKGPGIDLFKAIKKKLGDIPIIAEDLGVITDEVRELRDACGFPGMKVLQFAFNPDEARQNGMTNSFLPHNFETSNCIVYTGTHDNDTMQGWFENCSDEQLLLVSQYLLGKKLTVSEAKKKVSDKTLCKEMIKLAFASSAQFCVIPIQDILCAGNEARMNVPSTTGSNWSWRMSKSDFKNGSRLEKFCDYLSFITEMYGR